MLILFISRKYSPCLYYTVVCCSSGRKCRIICLNNKIKNVLIISDKETQKNISKSVRNIPDVKLINDDGALGVRIIKNVEEERKTKKKRERKSCDEKEVLLFV